MRALVISDTHFGAWTGEDLLSESTSLALLEPHLDVDEVIFLGDMFDLLFGPMRGAFVSAGGLLNLLRNKLQGKRFVFLAGNHDHSVVTREREDLLQLELAGISAESERAAELRRVEVFRRFLERRLDGVEIDIRYPTYTFADVLCTHGHYLDYYARRSGSAPSKLLARATWAVAVGGNDHVPTIDDFEATTRVLTGVLYTIAQMPAGCRAERRAFSAFRALGHATRVATAPARAMEHAGIRLANQLGTRARGRPHHRTGAQVAAYRGAVSREVERRRRTGAPTGGEAANAMARTVRPSDPSHHAVDAFEQVVMNLGWARDTDKIVFAHTHQPLEAVTGPSGRVRYWNTGSWIYEPDLSSHDGYMSYLRNAWPGTVVMIDSEETEPRLLRLREHLNPLHRM